MSDKSFDAKATDKEGRASEVTMEADSVEAVVDRLAEKGLQASEVRPSKGRRLFEPRNCSPEDFAMFNAELAAACERHVPLPSALRVLSREIRGSAMREALEAVARDVEGGADLPSAFARRADVFPLGYVALVESGLKSGDLSGTLLLFAEEARFSARVRYNLRSAVIYPLLVIFAGACFLSYAGIMLLPQFEATFAEMAPGKKLPVATRFVFALVPIFRWAPVLVVGVVVALALGWDALLRRSRKARAAARFVLSIPGIGGYLHAVALTRFCRTLSNALSGHVPVPQAISLAGLSSGNAAIQSAAADLRQTVLEGGPMSAGMQSDGAAFPATFVWMLSLSESRGEVGPALDEYARLQESRARRLGEALPLLTAALVGVVASVMLGIGVMAVFQPLIDLMRSIGQ